MWARRGGFPLLRSSRFNAAETPPYEVPTMKTLKGGIAPGREPILSVCAKMVWGQEEFKSKEREKRGEDWLRLIDSASDEAERGRQVDADERCEEAVADGNSCAVNSRHKDRAHRKPSGGPVSERSCSGRGVEGLAKVAR